MHYCLWRIKGKAFCQAWREEAMQAILPKANTDGRRAIIEAGFN